METGDAKGENTKPLCEIDMIHFLKNFLGVHWWMRSKDGHRGLWNKHDEGLKNSDFQMWFGSQKCTNPNLSYCVKTKSKNSLGI